MSQWVYARYDERRVQLASTTAISTTIIRITHYDAHVQRAQQRNSDKRSLVSLLPGDEDSYHRTLVELGRKLLSGQFFRTGIPSRAKHLVRVCRLPLRFVDCIQSPEIATCIINIIPDTSLSGEGLIESPKPILTLRAWAFLYSGKINVRREGTVASSQGQDRPQLVK